MANAPTIVAASLSDAELKKSIESMLTSYNDAMDKMVSKADTTVKSIQERLKNLGDIKVDSSGSSDGGSTKKAAGFAKLQQSIESVNEALKKHETDLANAKKSQSETETATDRQAKKNKEVAMSYDQILGALQMAQRQEKLYASKNPWSLTREESEKYAEAIKRVAELQDKLNKKMAEMRYNSVAQYTPNIGAYSRSLSRPVGDTKEYKELVAHIKEMARAADRDLRIALQNAFKMPANSIEEIRSKWAQLSALLKQTEGTNVFTPAQVSKAKEMEASLLQQLQTKKEISKTYDEEIQRMAQLIRQSEEYQKTRHFNFKSPYSIGTSGVADNTIIDETRKGALSIEEQLLRTRTRQSDELKRAVETSQEINWHEQQQIQLVNQQVEADHRAALAAKEKSKAEAEAAQNAQQSTQALQQQAQAQQQTTQQAENRQQPKNFAEYSNLADAIAHVLGLERKEVIMADELRDSQKRIAASLKQSEAAWAKLSAAMRNSENGELLKNQIDSYKSALAQLKKGFASPMDIEKAFKMPEDTIARITEKMQILTSLKSRINFDDVKGKDQIKDIADELDRLAEKSKKVQESTQSSATRAQKTMFAQYTKMPEGNIEEIERKLIKLDFLKASLNRKPLLNESQIASVTAKIEALESKLQRLRSVQATKENIDKVLGMSPKTLNEMAEKLQLLQAIKRNIDTTKIGAAEEFARIDREIIKVNKDMNQYMAQTREATKVTGALGRSWNYMKNRLAFYFTVGASTAFVKNLIEIRSQYEMTERALGILVQSAQRGSQIFSELSQMALVSPYTLIELSNAAKQLTAYGVAAKDVVDTTRRMGDMAAAVGIPMERLTYALGQIKAYGYLNSRDARMFLNAGIPLVQELSKHYSKLEGQMVSVADIYDRIKKKAIGYNDVMQVVTEMTDEGGRFFDFQAKMAGTLKVQMANLTLAWNNMLNDIGNSYTGLLNTMIGWLKELFLSWKNIEQTLRTLMITFVAAKAVQFGYLVSVRNIAKAEALATVTTKGFAAALVSLKNSMTAVSSHPIVAIFVLIATLLTQLAVEAYDAQRATEELNKSISDGAKESVKSINELIESYERLGVAARAAKGAIEEEEAKKIVDQIKESIELYSSDAATNIRDVLSAGDDNAQIARGIEYLERIRDANEALSTLYNEIKISTDNMWGLFGEGLAEDVQDYAEAMERVERIEKDRATWWDKFVSTGLQIAPSKDRRLAGATAYALGEEKEAISEIEKFAKDAAVIIREKLGEGISDPVAVREAVNRLIKEVEAHNPTMTGAGKKLFESAVVGQMSTEFEGVFSAMDYTLRDLMATVKSKYQHEFKDLTEDILDTSKAIAPKYKNAIEKVIMEMLTSNEIPTATKELLTKIQTQLDKNPPVIHFQLAQTFSSQVLDPLQRDFMNHFIEDNLDEGWTEIMKEDNRTRLMTKYARYNKKENEDFLEWEKRLQESLASTRKSIEAQRHVMATTSTNSVQYKQAEKQLDILQKEEEVQLEIIHYEGMREEASKGNKKDALLETLKQTIDIIKKSQSEYDTLTKKGESSADALNSVYSNYGRTLKIINAELQSFGLPQIDLTKLIRGRDPNEVLAFFEKLGDVLETKGLSNKERQKAVEVVVQEFRVKAKTYNLDKVTKGLNSELGRLKDEYELAVELDANPELSNIFMDMMGIDESVVKDLPKTAEQVAKRAQEKIQQVLRENNVETLADSFDISKLRNIGNLNDWMKSNDIEVDSDLYKAIRAVVDYVNKTRLDITKQQMEDWNKLLEKYSEYEYKLSQIQKTAVRERLTFAKKNGTAEQQTAAVNLVTQIDAETDSEKKQELINQLKTLVTEIAGADDVKLQIAASINQKELEESAQLSFEEFKKDPTWITATGDLALLADSALSILIKRIEEYKRTAKNLTPKQIKEINRTLKSLHKQLRQGNPFAAIVDAIGEANERTETYQTKIDELDNQAKNLLAKYLQESDSSKKNALGKQYDDLLTKIKKLKEEQKAAGKIDWSSVTESFQQITSLAGQVGGAFSSMFKALGNTEAAETLDKVSNVMSQTASFAAMGASVGGGWGAAIGGVIGLGTSLVTNFIDKWSGNAGITKAVEESEKTVKQLELAYIDLEHAIGQAYGSATIGAQKVAVENKKLQLEELKRQLSLEQSRKAKYRDTEKIMSLQQQIKQLEYDIADSIDEIVNNLLGISSVGDAAETLMDSFVEALRNGEDAMEAFNGNIDDMIANMVKKMLVTKIIQPWFDTQWQTIQDEINSRAGETLTNELARAQSAVSSAKMVDTSNNNALVDGLRALGFSDEEIDNIAKGSKTDEERNSKLKAAFSKALKDAESRESELQAMMTEATAISVDDIKRYAELLRSGQPIMDENMKAIESLLRELGLINDDTESNLSALQQGIQGVSEDTAGAIEAYMNGVSQQVYLHSDLLTQIRDYVAAFDINAQTGIQAQMLLQLQQSYSVQMSIQNILEGWSSANGMAVKVEMV